MRGPNTQYCAVSLSLRREVHFLSPLVFEHPPFEESILPVCAGKALSADWEGSSMRLAGAIRKLKNSKSHIVVGYPQAAARGFMLRKSSARLHVDTPSKGRT